MLAWLKTWPGRRNTAETLYGEIVSAARAPVFYRDWGVPDTVEGRFEMIALHLVLILDRLSKDGEAGVALGRDVTEACIADMDDNMREIGIGDLSVPRKVKKAAAALYDRHRDILAALTDSDRQVLERVLESTIGQLPGATGFSVEPLARYVVERHKALSGLESQQLLSGAAQLQTPATA
jgi:cytochrome b pre-mRNA-processing protein 3